MSVATTQAIATAIAQGTPADTAAAKLVEATAAPDEPTRAPTLSVIQPTSDPNADGSCGGPGLSFDHYLVVTFAAVEAGTDAIGGVEIDLPIGAASFRRNLGRIWQLAALAGLPKRGWERG